MMVNANSVIMKLKVLFRYKGLKYLRYKMIKYLDVKAKKYLNITKYKRVE